MDMKSVYERARLAYDGDGAIAASVERILEWAEAMPELAASETTGKSAVALRIGLVEQKDESSIIAGFPRRRDRLCLVPKSI